MSDVLERQADVVKIARLADEVARLREALRKVVSFRDDCAAYDDDMGHERRSFIDDEEWEMVEGIARAALEGR